MITRGIAVIVQIDNPRRILQSGLPQRVQHHPDLTVHKRHHRVISRNRFLQLCIGNQPAFDFSRFLIPPQGRMQPGRIMPGGIDGELIERFIELQKFFRGFQRIMGRRESDVQTPRMIGRCFRFQIVCRRLRNRPVVMQII